MTATTAQARYITNLREDKAWRAELPIQDRETFTATHGTRVDYDAYVAREEAGRAALVADLDTMTTAQASAAIDALKAW